VPLRVGPAVDPVLTVLNARLPYMGISSTAGYLMAFVTADCLQHRNSAEFWICNS